MRYAGQAFELPVPGDPEPDPADLVDRFEAAHEERYGHRDPDGEVVLVDIRLALVDRRAPAPADRRSRPSALDRESSRRCASTDEWVETPVLRGEPAAGLRSLRPRRSSSCPRRRSSCPPGRSDGRDRVDARRRGTLTNLAASRTEDRTRASDDRPDHPPGDDRRPPRRLRGDGRDADPLRLLGQHQGAPRLLDRALRRRAASW